MADDWPDDFDDVLDGVAATDGLLAESTDKPNRPDAVGEDAILRVIRVAPEQAGMRLDRFLATQLRATSRTRAQSIIEASAYSWEGRHLRSSDRVRAEQRISLWREALDEEPPPTAMTILAEDAELLVVNKPALMTVHPTARHHRYTVVRQLEEQRPEQYLSLIHRLDRETSGVLLVAKSRDAAREFKMRLEERSIAAARAADRDEPVAGRAEKTYLAITWGRPSRDGLVSEPLTADPSPLRVKMSICERGSGLSARTGVKVLATTGDYSLVQCDLYTGRQHQIRVHLAHLGAVIVGDKLYGPDEMLLARGADGCLTEDDLSLLELPRQALHAYQHRLLQCFTGEDVCFTAPLPVDLRDFWLSRGGEIPEGIVVAG